jgi:hypothetical protein
MEAQHSSDGGVELVRGSWIANANPGICCLVIGVGAALALAGSFMSWISGNIPVQDFGHGPFAIRGRGLDGEYVALVAVAVACCALWLFRHPSREVLVVTWVAVACLATTSVYCWRQASDKLSTINALTHAVGGTVSYAVGIWVVLLGVVLSVIGIAWATYADRVTLRS